ncbi:MAG: Na+ dependent nucleoside transporter domain protein, partial [Opitutae bacterium]|nr:Na+ dependent nucleoside transporter domain protein [Opitutae bacterium]
MLKLISLTGLVAFIALAWAISIKRGRFPWRTVLTGLGLQVALAAILIPDTIIGRSLYTFADGVAKNIVAFASKGTQLVFGDNNSFVLGITICGTIILVAVLSSLLYH